MNKYSKLPPPLNSILLLLLLGFASATNQPIKAMVVLVLENRSFDHMLGWMKSINPKINGLSGREYNPKSTQNPNSEVVHVSSNAVSVDPDPGHSFVAIKQQVFGSGSTPTMMGFVEQALTMGQNMSETVMKGFNPSSLPVFATLVEEFAVFDRWFSAVPGPTQPNRLFVYSATSQGAISHEKTKLINGFPQKTIFDSLHESGIDFGIYSQFAPTTLFYRNLRKLKYIFKFHSFSKFKKHAKDGKLRALSVIEPRYFDLHDSPANDDHPSHDVANGQKLVKEIYETLRASPQWNETLLIVTYDEHGGFYDHVITPAENVPSPDGIASSVPEIFKFDRLGVRVPTIMVSPWIKKGTVIHKPFGPTPNSEFEHSSIPATIKKMFNLSSNFLTHRDAWAGTFDQVVAMLTEPRTDCPVTLPNATPLRSGGAQEGRKLSEFQEEIVQLAAVLNGDHYLSSFPDQISSKMNVSRAHGYVKSSVARFIRASRDAFRMGADESAIVDMRASLTTRGPNN